MTIDILDYTYGPNLESGQTTDYTPAGRTPQDDGVFQRGIVGSQLDARYVILTTGQYSGTTDITVNSIVDAHSNECVFDKVTSLMWNRTVSAFIYGIGTETLLWDDSGGSDEDIFEYCDQANLSGLSGYSDWRISNIVELMSLMTFETPSGSPNSTAFPTWSTAQVYTSTTNPNLTTTAISIRFNTSLVRREIKTTVRQQCALVRLGIES